MSEKEIDEEKYRKMMNAGYLISMYDKELYAHIEKIQSPDPYVKALTAEKTGKITAEKSVSKSVFKTPDWLKGDKLNEKSIEPTKDKGIDKGFAPDI